MSVDEADDWTKNIDVIVVTFNSNAVIRPALQSLPRGVNVTIVDNGSEDRSVETAITEGAKHVGSEGNIGFGRASNLGARKTDAEFIFFMNPDAVLSADALETMYRTALRYPDAGIIGPRLVDGEGQTCLRYSSILHPFAEAGARAPCEPEAVCCMPLLTGAAMLCRRTAFEQVGGFDENIFLYYEDDDLCLRFSKAGWSLIYEPSAEVFHASGKSSPQTPEMVRFKSAERLLSRYYIAEKYALSFDPAGERRKALKRLFISLVKFDRLRFASALGRLGALTQLSESPASRSGVPCPHVQGPVPTGVETAGRHWISASPAVVDR